MLQFLIVLFIVLAILSVVFDMIVALAPILIIGAIVVFLYNRFAGGRR